MGRCVHHVPGRARFRLPGIRKGRSAAVRACLAALPGVTTIEINRAAGSLVVTYDMDRIGLDHVTTCLRRAGLLGGGRGHAPAAAGGGLVTQAGALFGRALFAAVLERSINRGVSALVGRSVR